MPLARASQVSIPLAGGMGSLCAASWLTGRRPFYPPIYPSIDDIGPGCRYSSSTKNDLHAMRRGLTMTPTATVQGFGSAQSNREDLKLRLATHLEQQPGSTQAWHIWMKRLMVAGVGIIVAAFIAAMYVSLTWRSIHPI